MLNLHGMYPHLTRPFWVPNKNAIMIGHGDMKMRQLSTLKRWAPNRSIWSEVAGARKKMAENKWVAGVTTVLVRVISLHL